MAAVPDDEKKSDAIEVKLSASYELKVGDRVVVDKNKKGQIRWVGEDRVLGVGVYYGVRLVQKRGTNNGTFKDKEFFWCPDGFGLVIPRTRIKKLYKGEDFDFSAEKKPEDPAIAKIKAMRSEMKRFRQKFKAVDTSGDGGLDVKEFSKLCKELFPAMTASEQKKLFEEIDATNNGNISYAEFDTWVKGMGGFIAMEQEDFLKILDKFKAMDADGDKKVSFDEFTAVSREIFPGLGRDQLAQVFNEIDISGDGHIQFDEYEEWVRQQ